MVNGTMDDGRGIQIPRSFIDHQRIDHARLNKCFHGAISAATGLIKEDPAR
jgi:hypothetical protein